jgi:hypothetical protein
LFLAGFAAVAAWAQFVTIENHLDTGGDVPGRCGSPGLRACEALPSCTDPSANVLRDDYYTGQIQCNLPGAELGFGKTGSLPPLLRLYQNGAATPSDTFFTTTDLHFGSTATSDADHVRHTRFMNQFPSLHKHWPAGVGFPDEEIHPPAAIITTGDNAHDGQSFELGAYRLLYEQSWINESTQFPVLAGLGNHDVQVDCGLNNCAQRMFDYVAGHVAGGVGSLDTGSDNYSWDWNGVHFLQLNKWAGDTQLGGGSTGTTHASGITWLRNDLANNVGTSGRPIVVFQHFGLDEFSLHLNDQGVADWWSDADRRKFWDVIRPYNVIGMFTGHRHATGMYDFSENDGLPEKHIDDFVGGTGGEDHCLYLNDAACGGRGHFFAVRITDQYLDVASLEWKSNIDGTDLDTAPQFTNLAPPSYSPLNPDDTTQGPAFVNGQMGCRKIINRQLIDVSSLVSNVGSVFVTSGTALTITNTSQITIPGPVALRLTFSKDQSNPPNLINKNFVDYCTNGSSYMYPDSGSTGDLAAAASLTFTPKFDGISNLYYDVDSALVRVGKTSGSDPAKVDLTGTPSNLPADGTITVFGPPNTAFTATPSVQSSTANWVSITSNSSQFDQFGMATFRYVLNRGVLANDRNNATEMALLKVTSGVPTVETDVWVTLHLRTADSFTLTSSWFPEVPLGQTTDFKIVASYVPFIVDGGASLITGTVTLNDTNGAVLATGYLNNHSDENPQPDNTVLFPSITLSPGIHTLRAVYAGDSFYAPNTSPAITVSVGRPTLKLSTNPPNLNVVLDGSAYKAPAVLGLPYLSTHLLTVFPQSATGARFVFSAWADGSPGPARTITVDQSNAEYTANFDAQYRIFAAPNDPAAGTVTVAPPTSDGYYPANSMVTVTATPNPGFVFKNFSPIQTSNPGKISMTGPITIVGFFALQTKPVITWPTPADIFYGTPLSARQLNATASVPGTFVYMPAAGSLLTTGSGQPLTATFTPADPSYATTTTTVKINVLPVATAGLTISTGLTRNSAANLISLSINITNTGATAVNNVQLTTGRLGSVAGTPLPQSLGTIATGGSVTAAVTFPASADATGAASNLSIGGSYSGGSFSKAARVVLP